MSELIIQFDKPTEFELSGIRSLGGVVGLYFIFTKDVKIHYPFRTSRLIYIGMSEKKTNSISSRLKGHFDGASKNVGLSNYRKMGPLYFTFINFEMLRNIWDHRIENLEAYFILDYVQNFGVYPICNNKTGFEVLEKEIDYDFLIDWSYFD